ncbi:hypothetical protein VB695_10145 [Nodularia spumigena UHCC 0060]|uniref:Uncharacterized protein n=1 Tax=Nodularia spumigena UHCC 0060 TaxID=3110300 RepID=A0ABU5US78_NODSP|nr:hypothetical protein [Nodularia spumigena UHCC 0060]
MPPASECFALSPPLLQVRFAIAQPTVRIAPTKFLREKPRLRRWRGAPAKSDRITVDAGSF